MLDTLKIALADYGVTSQTKLIVQSLTEAGTGDKLHNYPLWYLPASGQVIEGSKAFYNDNRFNLTVTPTRGCFVHFSVPRLFTGSNYRPVGQEGCRAVLGAMEGFLRDVGVHCDIWKAKLSRVDSFRNVITSEPYPVYHQLFNLLQARRTQKRDYGTTFLWHNTQQQFTVYDKIQEMRFKHVNVSDYPANTLRFEHRLLNSRKVHDSLGFDTVLDLQNNYGDIEKNFVSSFGENLFKYEVKDVQILCQSELEAELITFKNLYGRYWFSSYLEAVGLQSLLKRGNMDVLKKAVESVSGNRMLGYRLSKKMERAQLNMELLQKDRVSGKTLSSLYTELKEKVLCLH
jgi:hypothetical protein